MLPKSGGDAPLRSKVFICYSQKDAKYLDLLKSFLSPIERAGLADVWVDTRISYSKKWRVEIQEALDATKVAILLVSIDFLNSVFINKVELPQLLDAAQKDGLYIVPVIVRPCKNSYSLNRALEQFQMVNKHEHSIKKMKPLEREEFWDELLKRILDMLSGIGR